MSVTLLYLDGNVAAEEMDSQVDALMEPVRAIRDVREPSEDLVEQHARDKNLRRVRDILPKRRHPKRGTLIRNLVDLFDLTPTQIGKLDDIGPKRLNLILSWITSLGLPEPGPQNSALIAAARNKLTTSP